MGVVSKDLNVIGRTGHTEVVSDMEACRYDCFGPTSPTNCVLRPSPDSLGSFLAVVPSIL